MRAPVAAHSDQQRRRPMSERLVREPTCDGVSRHALGAALPTPRVIVNDPALQHGPTEFDQLADSNEAELVKTAERGQVRDRERRVEHVEVFRDGKREELPSSGRPRPLPGQQRAQPTTPSFVKSHFHTDPAWNLNRAIGSPMSPHVRYPVVVVRVVMRYVLNMTLELSDSLLAKAGFRHLTPSQVAEVLRDLYDVLELRVGRRLARKTTDASLVAFERLAEDDLPAYDAWFSREIPDYREQVADELDYIVSQLREAALSLAEDEA